MKYTDPSGEEAKKQQEEQSWYSSACNWTKNFAVDTANNFVDLVGGTSYSIMDNYSYGVYSKLNKAPNSTAGQVGQVIGDSLTYAVSTVEMIFGGTLFGSGVVVSPLAFAGAPVTAGGTVALDAGAIAVGATIATHGGSVAVYTATKGNGGSSGSINQTSKVEKISPNELKPTETPKPSRIKELENSMDKNGYYSSKAVKYYEYEGEKYIVDGHHRTEAAKNLGIDVFAKPVDESYFAKRWGKTAGDFIDKILNFSK